MRPGETISSTSFERKPGGKGANQAYAVARAGGSVELDGCIGGDGDWIRGVLQEAGVGVQLLRTAEGEVGLAVLRRRS